VTSAHRGPYVEEAMKMVPQKMKDAAYGMGAPAPK